MGLLTRLIGRRDVLYLAAMAVAIVTARLHTFRRPANMDISLAQVFGHELLRGQRLYTDLWDIRPPLTYAGYAAAELLVGWGDAQILLLGSILAIITLLGIWAAVEVVDRRAALVACALWVLLQADVLTEAHHPNGEAFINACVAWGVALIARGRTRCGPALLWATASLLKTNTVVIPAALAVAHIATSADRRRALRDVGAWVVAGAVAWAALFAWFAAHGRLHDFIAAVFEYSAFYGGSPVMNLVRGVMPWALFPRVLIGALPAALLAALVFLLPAPRVRRVLLAAALAGAWLAVALPGRAYPHYYQLYFPVLCIGAGWGAVALGSRVRPVVYRAVVGIILVATALMQLPGYTASEAEWIRMAAGDFPGHYAAQADAIPRVLGILPPGATLYQAGIQPGYYVAAQRSPPTGVLFVTHMCSPGGVAINPVAERLTARVMDELDRAQPAVVIRDDVAARWCAGHPVYAWIHENYTFRPELTRSAHAQIFTRTDSTGD